MSYSDVTNAFLRFTEVEDSAEAICQAYLYDMLKQRTKKCIEFNDLQPMTCYDGRYQKCHALFLCSNGILVELEDQTCSFDELYAHDQFELCDAVEEIIRK